ncbi:hypothetical protein GCM10025864_03840 [Luteimicrobium album]|uniref:Uncharacterized protein n=1 Tax=Luteimicrobium album TaxID=1054550 RepID=A0ABQ6HW94_9MICO|nr:hypothetical protein [Luteimicrobium album]GMA22625.1 hypothetical protein GCM10025864_03840 [Luteimicrobium album]
MTTEPERPLATLDPPRAVDDGPRPVLARRIGTVALVLVVVAGALNLFGLWTTTTTTSEDGWTVSVHYARIARAGLDAPWEVTVEHPGGFGKDVELRVTTAYFDIFESQGLDPEPSDETSDGTDDTWTFETPEGDTFEVAFDAYIQPSSHRGASDRVAVLVHGREVASTPFRTTLLP